MENLKKASILIIEDDDSLRKALVLMFKEALREEENLEIQTVRNGEEGLEICRETDFDLIITDLMMPIKNGWEFLDDFRKMDTNTPVLAMSAKNPDPEDGELERFVGFLIKPFDMDTLVSMLKNCLG